MLSLSRQARIAEGHRLYVVGDIHGRFDLLTRLVERIDADMAQAPAAVATEIYLGDYVDRGPASAQVLRLLIERQRVRNMVCLVGNHEVYMMEALRNRAAFESWLPLGARETLKSFGVQPPSLQSVDSAFRAFGQAIGEAERRFLNELLPLHRVGDYLFVHAGVKPGVPLAQQQLTDLTTIRKPFFNAARPFGLIVVHGHTPVAKVETHAARINVDTGAYMTGNLSCLVIEPDRLRLL
ncbi:MAG: serine/threonine protein phosphatase [Gemmatimonadaceae bacterium]|nr:serine/threonine protein phosphatase [Gemmatimonadaceae bacterium]